MADFNSDWQGHPIWQTGQPANVNYHTYHINMINMDRRATPPWQVISPTWGPPLSCKQALKFLQSLSSWNFVELCIWTNRLHTSSCNLFSFLPFLLFIFYKLSFFVLFFFVFAQTDFSMMIVWKVCKFTVSQGQIFWAPYMIAADWSRIACKSILSL